MRAKKFLSLLLSAAMAFTLLTATAFAAAPPRRKTTFRFSAGQKYTYLYAALTWDEYWASETVYAALNAAASAQLDSHEEQDLGAFDAVSRATVNHGLHRGSFQSTAVIYAKDGSSYTVSHWSEGWQDHLSGRWHHRGLEPGHHYQGRRLHRADGSLRGAGHQVCAGARGHQRPCRFLLQITPSWKTAVSWWAATLKRT